MKIQTDSMAAMQNIVSELVETIAPLRFKAPVTHVYNPLVYARRNYDAYCRLSATGPKEVLLLGMNPGPWGMAQTGIPFGDAAMVSEWLGLNGPVDQPTDQHPKRPVQGFQCPRGEVSGRRLWGWARERFGDPGKFFSRFWVGNYCPLVFMEASGRNRTPDKLPKGEKQRLFAACNRALRRTVELLQPAYVVGVGKFAEERAKASLGGLNLAIGRITHPSPANPKANQGWARLVESELAAMGILI